MTKSRKAEVNITQATLTGQNAQQAAESSNKKVDTLYDPNMMSVGEKQATYYSYSGVQSRFNVVLTEAKDAGLDTTALEAAYNNMNSFMNSVLSDATTASDVDRATYGTLQADFNSELAKMQNNLGTYSANQLSTATSLAVTSKATAEASKTESANAIQSADNAVATANVVSQTMATLKGGSTVTMATLENGLKDTVSNGTYTDDITRLSGLIQAKVSYDPNLVPFSGYPTDTTGWTLPTCGEADATFQLTKHGFYHNSTDYVYVLNCKTDEGKSIMGTRFSVKPNTVYRFTFKGFASSNMKGTSVYFLGRKYGETEDYTDVHQLIDSTILSPSRLDSRTVTFNTGASQEGYIRFDNQGSSNGGWAGLYFTELQMNEGTDEHDYVRSMTAAEVNLTAESLSFKITKGDLVTSFNAEAGQTVFQTNGQLTLSADSVYFDTKNPVQIPSANITNLLSDKTITGATIMADIFSTKNDTFMVDANGAITATSLSLIGNKNNVYNSELMANAAGWVTNQGKVDWATSHAGSYGMVWNGTSASNAWDCFGQSKPMPIMQSNDRSYSLSVWFIDWTSTKGMQYQATLAFMDANKKRIETNLAATTYTNPDGSSHTWQLMTIEGITPPDGAMYVCIQYWAHAGTGHAGFSQPMISQSKQYQGYTSDSGNVISTTETDGSVTRGVTIADGQIYLSAGSSDVNEYGYQDEVGSATIDAVNGLNLYGNMQQIVFNGKLSDAGTKGIKFTEYGNINATSNQLTWYIGYDNNHQTASFGIDQDGTKTIAFSRKTYINQPLYVDDIYSNYPTVLRLSNQLQDANDRTALYLDNDGSQRVWSTSVWNRTYTTSQASQMAITSQGTLGRFGSASKYKLNISHDKDLTLANRLLTVDVATWFDKTATYRVADSLSNGTTLDDPIDNVKPITGLIAEDLQTAGLDMFLATGEDGTLEGIAYDRLWITLIPKIREMNNRINELERLVAAK